MFLCEAELSAATLAGQVVAARGEPCGASLCDRPSNRLWESPLSDRLTAAPIAQIIGSFVRFTWPLEDCDGNPDNCCWFLVD